MAEKDNQDLMYGFEEYKFNGTSLGYVAEGSFDHGGKKPEYTAIRAAQVKGYAVKNIAKTNGTIAPTFDLIQFNYPNMAKTMGGRILTDGAKKPIGWAAPSAAVLLSGYHEIFSDAGQVIVIPSGLVLGSIQGGLTLDDTSKLNLEIAIEQPAAEGVNALYILDATEYTPYDPVNPSTALTQLKAMKGYTLEEYQAAVSGASGAAPTSATTDKK